MMFPPFAVKVGMGSGTAYYSAPLLGQASKFFLPAIVRCRINRTSLQLASQCWFLPAFVTISMNFES